MITEPLNLCILYLECCAPAFRGASEHPRAPSTVPFLSEEYSP